MLYRVFIAVICIMLAVLVEIGHCRVIVRSVPMKCQVSFLEQNIDKDREQIEFDDVNVGVYPIVFKYGGETLKGHVEIKPDDNLLVNGNFEQMNVMATVGISVSKDGALMVRIPAGEFQMGSDIGEADEFPVHTVYTDAFYMDVFEVTNSQYARFMKETGYKAPVYWADPKHNGPDQPVVGLTWDDAQAYCKWAEKRLPTEAEWEKAARGGLIGMNYPWGDDAGVVSMEEVSGTGARGTYPVGSVKPNDYGIYDADGNVWEWCLDWYDENYYAKLPRDNPKGPESGENRIIRGGSWSAGVYYPLRVSFRYSLEPDETSNLIGFRCVKPSQ